MHKKTATRRWPFHQLRLETAVLEVVRHADVEAGNTVVAVRIRRSRNAVACSSACAERAQTAGAGRRQAEPLGGGGPGGCGSGPRHARCLRDGGCSRPPSAALCVRLPLPRLLALVARERAPAMQQSTFSSRTPPSIFNRRLEPPPPTVSPCVIIAGSRTHQFMHLTRLTPRFSSTALITHPRKHSTGRREGSDLLLLHCSSC